MPRVRTAVLALPLLAAPGCAPAPTSELPLKVTTTFPADGAAAVPEESLPLVLLTLPIPEGDPFAVTLGRGGDAEPLTCHPGDDGVTLACPLDEPLRADTRYRVEVDLYADGETDATSQFTTALPEGLGFDVGPGLAVVQAGGEPTAAALLEQAIADEGSLFVCLHGFPGDAASLPWQGDVLLGRGEVLPGPSGEGEGAVREDEGYPLAAPGGLDDDGRLDGVADAAFLPVSVDGVFVPLLVRDVRVSGDVAVQADFGSVMDFELSARVPERAVDDLLAAVPDWALLLGEFLVLDVDTDGDGRDDSATLILRGQGERITLVGQLRGEG